MDKEQIRQLIREEIQGGSDELVRQIIKEELAEFIFSDKFVYKKHQQLLDGRNFQFGNNKGTQIGTEATQKLAFFGATPIVQPSNIPYASGGSVVDSQARAVQSIIIDTLDNLGLTA